MARKKSTDFAKSLKIDKSLRRIYWKEKDYKALHKAVDRFNRIIDKVSEKELDTIPDKIDYYEIKETIKTRQGLYDKIESLNRLTEENVTKVHVTKGQGLRVSEYSWQEVERAVPLWQAELKKEYDYLSVPQEGETESRVRMGTSRARQVEKNLKRDIIDELEMARDTTDFNDKFQATLNRISPDAKYMKAIQYKENYLALMEANYKNLDHYEDFYEAVKNLTPAQFYEFMNQDAYAVDLYYQSEQYYGQAEFDTYLQSIGILNKEKVTS